tara:strand:+ start:177 stop:368 length:192 start_codon:yes stop_codon:yes gene_type:complete
LAFKVKGRMKGKPYLSRKSFRTQAGALKHGYGLTYNPSGNTKRKTSLTNWHVVKTQPKKRGKR